ncbi:polysaccharide deacetylase family protein [Glaciecola sp. 1036]|uniref:polysaccharide deacetylase family protein n=1 Tax=Alteromonadaceae TaxID=72275 RepID=UPI003CFCD762
MKLYQAFALFGLLFTFTLAKANQDVASSVEQSPTFTILQYHHVSENTPPVTSISASQLEKHLAHLAANHNVISLEQGVKAIKEKTKLPDNAVAITFDDGYANIYENGFPLLKKYNFPFTIFVNPDTIGTTSSQLSWQQLEEMSSLATYANHTIGHIHLLNKQQNETENQWLSRVMNNIIEAENLLNEKLGYSKKWLAYPFGEFNHKLKQALLQQGFLGFAQHSGAVGVDTDMGAIPRFPAAGIYANLNTLKVKLESLPMSVDTYSPFATEQALSDKLNSIEINLKHSRDIRLNQATCYFQGNLLATQTENEQIKVALNHQFSPGRIRINCTAPSEHLNGRFFWYSVPYFTPNKNGNYPD